MFLSQTSFIIIDFPLDFLLARDGDVSCIWLAAILKCLGIVEKRHCLLPLRPYLTSSPIAPKMPESNVICMKWGNSFGPEYINRLYRGVRRYVQGDLRFFCVTDDHSGIRSEVEIIDYAPLPFASELESALALSPRKGPMQKIAMQNPDLISDLRGPLLALDIDIVVTGSLDELFSYAPGKVCMRRIWAKPSRRVGLGNGSACRFDPKVHHYLYEDMMRDPAGCVARAHGSEQSHVSWTAFERGDLCFFPDHWCASFKYDCRPTRPMNLFKSPVLPEGARLVFFHGKPKMSEAVHGYRSDPLHSTLPAFWLQDAWRDE